MKTVEYGPIDKEDLRHMTDVQLARLGIEVIDRQRTTFRCRNCNETWSPDMDFNGKLPFDYWVCPRKCNRE